MDLFITSFLIVSAGGIIAFLTAIYNNISLEDIANLPGIPDEDRELLIDLNNKQEYAILGLNIIEAALYIIAGSLICLNIYIYFGIISYQLLAFSALFLYIFFQRTILSAIAARHNIYFGLKLSGLLSFIFAIGMPISKIYWKLFVLIAGKEEEDAARDEINALVESAMEEGSLDEDEYRIMKNAMHFSEVLVSDVMTPRTVIFSLEADKTVSQVLNLPELMMYSRFPVWQGKSLDDGAVGYVVTKDILNAALRKKGDQKLREFARELNYIPENSTLDTVLEQFLKQRKHIFLVVDEYGGIEGLISMEDIMENILGAEIVDEADSVVDLRELAKQRRDRRIKNMPSPGELDETLE